MTKNEIHCNDFATEAMQIKGFLAMHAIIHSPRYWTASHSHWESNLPTFRELIDYKLEFGTFLVLGLCPQTNEFMLKTL